jgi:FdhD protein
MISEEFQSFDVIHYSSNRNKKNTDNIAIEEPLEISLIYTKDSLEIKKNISITMRTPGNDENLSLGFLVTEGIISKFHELEQIFQNEKNEIVVKINKEVQIDFKKLERHFYTSSSCGVCGKSSINAIKTLTFNKKNVANASISKEIIYSLKNKISDKQNVFNFTGGLHASFLFDLNGNLEHVFEDVGRHNALDKLIGNCFLTQNYPLSSKILLLSGRISFELIQKAIMAEIPVVCAFGAPSSLAIELAKEFNVTLIGFLKNDSFNLYNGEITN